MDLDRAGAHPKESDQRGEARSRGFPIGILLRREQRGAGEGVVKKGGNARGLEVEVLIAGCCSADGAGRGPGENAEEENGRGRRPPLLRVKRVGPFRRGGGIFAPLLLPLVIVILRYCGLPPQGAFLLYPQALSFLKVELDVDLASGT